jgi:Protein of unknown function (DUF1475)
MSARLTLKLLFGAILVGMIGVTSWASVTQSVWQWQGLVRAPDHAWTIATLCDAYAGFITFYVWVYWREQWLGRILWFWGIMLLGNMVMSLYMLIALWRLPADQPITNLWMNKHA